MEKQEPKTNERQDAKQFPFPGTQANYDITHFDGAKESPGAISDQIQRTIHQSRFLQ